MAFFESFTASIRQKWLDYYQANRPWLMLQMEGRSTRTPDGGRRPTASLVLGVVNALEPKLGNLMVPFFKLNSDEDALVEVLGLDFDPDLAISGTAVTTSMDGKDHEISGLLPTSDPSDHF